VNLPLALDRAAPAAESHRLVLPVRPALACGGAGAGRDQLADLRPRPRVTLRKKTEDAADLRTELIGLGVVVRDQGGGQYWRLADRPDALDP
jgi:hypothetical protein